MPPLLSILIPTRNRAALLKYAIQSALAIPSESIEIIVSENHGSDDGFAVCQSFSDPRLRVLRPESPLPMHENFEFLLKQSRGQWVTFLGDDDAIMPHAADHLSYLTQKYPQAEAIHSPRAYYFWDGLQEQYGPQCVRVSFSSREQWCDSKKKLKQTLDGKLHYIHLPQMYSGGFHRRSLINRVLRSQNGVYFKSISPDAYAALMACIHTYRYLETGIPMSWVGSSPHQASKAGKNQVKNREQDFFGLHSDESLTAHRALGDLKVVNFTLHFYETYISAIPITSYKELSLDKVRQVYLNVVRELRRKGNKEAEIQKLSVDLGFEIPPEAGVRARLADGSDYAARKWTKLSRRVGERFSSRLPRARERFRYGFESTSHEEYPNIQSADHLLAQGYNQWLDARC